MIVEVLMQMKITISHINFLRYNFSVHWVESIESTGRQTDKQTPFNVCAHSTDYLQMEDRKKAYISRTKMNVICCCCCWKEEKKKHRHAQEGVFVIFIYRTTGFSRQLKRLWALRVRRVNHAVVQQRLFDDVSCFVPPWKRLYSFPQNSPLSLSLSPFLVIRLTEYMPLLELICVTHISLFLNWFSQMSPYDR